MIVHVNKDIYPTFYKILIPWANYLKVPPLVIEKSSLIQVNYFSSILYFVAAIHFNGSIVN